MKLDLGACDDKRAGYLSVDVAGDVDVVANLYERWPWQDGIVEEIRAWDVAEHLDSQIHFFNEAHRCLQPGGVLDLAVPCVYLADGRVNPGAFADPTHRQYFTLDTRYYYGIEWNDPLNERGRFGKLYGITALFRGEWKLIEYGAPGERRSKIMAKLEAVK